MKGLPQLLDQFIILFSFLHLVCLADISNLRKCADELCTVKISEGRTTQRYFSRERGILSFSIDGIVEVYSKEAGTNPLLWGVEITDGAHKKKGFIPKKFIVEERVFVKEDQLNYTVPTIPTDQKGKNNKKSVLPENELKPTTNQNENVKDIVKNVLDVGKVIDQVPELSFDDPLKNVISNGVDLNLNNGVNKEPLNAGPNLQSVLNIELSAQSSDNIIEKVSIGDQNQDGFSHEDAIVKSSELMSKKTEIFSEGKFFNDLSQNNEKIESEEESKATSEVPTIQAKESSDEINRNINSESSKILHDLSDVRLEIGDSIITNVITDNAKEQNIVDGYSGVNDKDGEEIDNEDDDDEEMDNEDEGNGNEGEENGKEMDIKLNSGTDELTNNLLEGKEKKGDLALKKDMVTNLPEEITTTVPSDIIPTSKAIKDSKSESLPKPTPLRNFEVFEGTTLFVDDVSESSSDSEVTSAPVDVSSTPLPLQASQVVNEKQESHATPHYESTPVPIVTADGLNVLSKDKIIQLDVNIKSNAIIDNEQLPSLPSNVKDASIVDPVISSDGKEVISDVLSDKNEIKDPDTAVDMLTNSDEIVQTLDITKPDSTNSKFKIHFSSKAESKEHPESFFEDSFVLPKPESILTEYDSEADKPLEEPENKGFIGTFFNNFGSSQDTSVEKEPLDEQSTGTITDINEKQQEEENETESIDLPFSDPYNEIPTESVNVSESISDNIHQEIHSGGQTQEAIIEMVSAVESSSYSEVILGIPRKLVGEGFALAIEEEIAHPHLSKQTISLLAILAVVIVTLYIAHSIIVKTSREAPLLNAMNKLDKEQRLVIEENNNLKRMLSTSSNGQAKFAGSNVFDHIEFVRLKDELSNTKSNLEKELDELKHRNLQLEKDLESSTANEEELNRMISELLSNQNDTQSFEESVNFLQMTLDDQKEKVESLTADLSHKTRLNDELRVELRTIKDRSSKLEYQIEQLAQSLDEMKSLRQDAVKRLSEEENNVIALREINNSMSQEADTIRQQALDDKATLHNLKETVKDLRKKLDSKIAECKVSKECFKRLQLCSDGGNNTKGKLAEIFKIVEVKAKLDIAEKERLESESKLAKEVEEHELVNKFMVDLQMQRDEMQEKLSYAETERDDVKAKLNILNQVYEEKISQLKSELESQEELRQDAEGSAADITSRAQSFKLELQSYKDQVLSLKQELEKQQQSYKLQLANEEKKLNDTWLSARNAERRQEELRQENSQLRQKLTQMHKESDQSMLLKNSIKRGETNGSLSSPVPGENDFDGLHSPNASLPMDFEGPLPHMPPMFMPHHFIPGHPPHLGPAPPHPGFLPPFMGPPPPHLPPPHPPHPDRRLPPAGRIASPPGYDRRSYSPASDYSDHRYSPSPRYSPGGGNRNRSPDRRSDRSRHSNVNMRRKDPASPDRWYARSPQRYKQRQSPNRYINHDDNLDESKGNLIHAGKKTSTPLGPNDR